MPACTGPAGSSWGRWGDDDERGALNYLTPARVIEAVRLVRTGQTVKVRYDAFPYQKFGVQEARISAVSASAVHGGALRNGAAPAGTLQPHYRVLATPANQSISAFGNAEPLRPGMALSADVILEHRSLLEWLLEPLFSMQGS